MKKKNTFNAISGTYNAILAETGIQNLIDDMTNYLALMQIIIGIIGALISIVISVSVYRKATNKEDKEKAKEDIKKRCKDVIETGKDIVEDLADDGKLNNSNKQ